MGFTAPVFGWLVLGFFNPRTPQIKPLDGHFLPPTSSLAPFVMLALSKVMALQRVSNLEQVGGGVAGILAAIGKVETKVETRLV